MPKNKKENNTISVSEKDKVNAENAGKDAQGVLDEMESLVIASQEDMEFAAAILKEIKGKAKNLTAMRDAATKPMAAALSTVRSWFLEPLKLLLSCEKQIKLKMSDAMDSEHDRMSAALQEVGDLAVSQGSAGSTIQEVNSKFSDIAGISTRISFSFDILDMSKVPDKYIAVCEKTVMSDIRAAKGNINIPGIRVIRNTSIAASSK